MNEISVLKKENGLLKKELHTSNKEKNKYKEAFS